MVTEDLGKNNFCILGNQKPDWSGFGKGNRRKESGHRTSHASFKEFCSKKKKYWAQELKGDTGSTGGVEERLFHDVTAAGYVSWTQAIKEIPFCKHPL